MPERILRERAPDRRRRGPCPLESVYFDFDRATLTNEATTALGNNATCLKKAERR